MKSEDVMTYILDELKNKYACHTIILYGSRARGQETATSDYDVLGVRDEGAIIHDARLWNGAYLDLFVYPEEKLRNPDESGLYLLGGKVLLEKDSLGQEYFKKLEEIEKRGPKLMSVSEVQALKVWAHKSLARIKAGGLEGNYRRAEILPALLEHYFTTRGRWYRGPKTSFQILKKEHPELFAAFNAAFEPNAPIAAFEKLVTLAEKS